MGRKGKTQKHTAREIAGKVKAAKERNGAAGHGSVGQAAREAARFKSSVPCEICKAIQPSMKTMAIHYESKHAKDPFPTERYDELFGTKKEQSKAKPKVLLSSKTEREEKKKKKNDLSLLDEY